MRIGSSRFLMHVRTRVFELLVPLVLLTIPVTCRSGDEVIRDPNSWDFAPLLYYDLIVRGVVERVDNVQVDTGDIFMDATQSHLNASLLRVSVKVSDVFRGPEVGDRCTFLCTSDQREAADFFLVGRDVVICGKYNEKLHAYYHPSIYGRYWREGGVWKSQQTPRGMRTFTDAELLAKIRSVDLQHTSAEAELVLEGTIVSTGTSHITGPDGSSAELATITLRIDRLLKGEFTSPQIVVVAITRGLYIPTWRAHVPGQYVVGQRWLCFLKKNDAGWYPFAGTNGFLRVSDAKYVYDERVEFWHSMKTVEKVIHEAPEAKMR